MVEPREVLDDMIREAREYFVVDDRPDYTGTQVIRRLEAVARSLIAKYHNVAARDAA